CSATYKVSGLYPAVGCEQTMTVMGPDRKPKQMGTGMPDETACSPCPDLAAGRSLGSGIGPDIQTVCDPDALYCLPKTELPSLRSTALVCQQTVPPPASGGDDAGSGGGDDAGAPAADGPSIGSKIHD